MYYKVSYIDNFSNKLISFIIRFLNIFSRIYSGTIENINHASRFQINHSYFRTIVNSKNVVFYIIFFIIFIFFIKKSIKISIRKSYNWKYLGQNLSNASFKLWICVIFLDISCSTNPVNAWQYTSVACKSIAGSIVVNLLGVQSLFFSLLYK